MSVVRINNKIFRGNKVKRNFKEIYKKKLVFGINFTRLFVLKQRNVVKSKLRVVIRVRAGTDSVRKVGISREVEEWRVELLAY